MLDVLIALYVLMAMLCIVGAMMFLNQNKRCGVWMTPVAVLAGVTWPIGVYAHLYNKRAEQRFALTCATARVAGWHRYRYVVLTPDGQPRPLVNDHIPNQEVGDTVWVAIYSHTGVDYRRDTKHVVQIADMERVSEAVAKAALRPLGRRWWYHFRTGL